MGEDRYQMFHPWGNTEADEEDISDSMSSSFEHSNNSVDSSSSSDLVEDASSSSSSSTSYSSMPPQMTKGPLYELSEFMAQLPIKRGLSKHFQGKSQSFTSLSNVNFLEDLAKRENPCNKRMKSCKSYAGFALSKTISKKASLKRSSSLLNNKRIGVTNTPGAPLFYKRTFDA